MYILCTVTLKVAEGLFNQSNAEYICSKSLKKWDHRGISCGFTISWELLAGNKVVADLSKNKGKERKGTLTKVCTGDL